MLAILVETTTQRWKKLRVLALLLIFLGILFIARAPSTITPDEVRITGLVLTRAGAVGYVYTMIILWWQHGQERDTSQSK
jgi:drug/metabolite transporter (DMT)-like permease